MTCELRHTTSKERINVIIIFKPAMLPQPAFCVCTPGWFRKSVCEYLSTYLCLSIHTHVSKIINGKSSQRSKSEMKYFTLVNFALRCFLFSSLKYGCGDSPQTVNYLPSRFHRHLTIEKQWCRTCRLPGIAYPFS